MVRNEDPTGVSGTGEVGEGAILSSGKCVVSWHSTRTITLFDSFADVERIHDHGGKTVFPFLDPES